MLSKADRKITVGMTSYSRRITGSNTIITIKFSDGRECWFMVDLGLVQEEDLKSNNDGKLPYDIRKIMFGILTHFHADHCGMYPILQKKGFDGKIYCSEETKMFVPPMLNEVSERIMEDYKKALKTERREKEEKQRFKDLKNKDREEDEEQEARRVNGQAKKEAKRKQDKQIKEKSEAEEQKQKAKGIKGNGKKDYKKQKKKLPRSKLLGPVYTKYDARDFNNKLSSQPMGIPFSPAPGIEITFYENAHVVGAVLTVVRAFDKNDEIYFLITGDIGVKNRLTGTETYMPREISEKISFVMSEATYGDQKEKVDKVAETQKMKDLIKRAYNEKKRLVIAGYAFERLATVASDIAALEKTSEMNKYLKEMPKGYDTKLGVAYLNILKKIVPDLKLPKNFRIISEKADRDYVKRLSPPYILFLTSAHLRQGAILAYLEFFESRNTIIMIPGYVPEHVKNYMVLEKGKEIKINGTTLELNCEIQQVKSYTAHMDKWELMEFLSQFTNANTVLFHHGSDKAKGIMADAVVATGKSAQNMLYGKTIKLNNEGIIKIY